MVTLAGALAGVGACEGNQLYGAEKIGVTKDSTGRIVFLTFSCATTKASAIRVGPLVRGELMVEWRADAQVPLSGLSRVAPADATASEFTMSGALRPDDDRELHASMALSTGGTEVVVFTPAKLRSDSIHVTQSSFGGETEVSEARFVDVNQGWCSRRP